jgi:hypothetical protein
MAHSEMQAPKSIPIVKLLRFQEIPVGTLRDIVLLEPRPQATTQPSNSDPSTSVEVQRPVETSVEQPIATGPPDRP